MEQISTVVIAIGAAIGAALTGGGGLAAQAQAPQPAPQPQLPTIGIPHDWAFWHQPVVSPQADGVVGLHGLLFFLLAAIVLLVFGLMAYVVWRYNARRNPVPSTTSHNTLLEVAWTILPVLILLVIAVPSFRLLYYIERTPDPELTLVIHGYQWYWGYEFPDQQIAEFSSFMIPDDQLPPDKPRILTADPVLLLPVDTNIQLLVTAGDVIHSWFVPAFEIKRDAIPGRMNETWVRIDQEGIYYGQCFELCGTGHAYMPIEVHAVSREAFDGWVMQQTAGLDLPEPPKLLTRAHPAAGETVVAGRDRP